MTPEERLSAFRQFVEKRPDDPFARYSLAMQLRSMGGTAEAAAELRELVKRTPDYLAAYLMLGQVLDELGETADAVRTYEAGVEVATKAGNTHARGELSKALDSLRRVLGAGR